MNEAGDRGKKGWEYILGENVIKYACGKTGFRKEEFTYRKRQKGRLNGCKYQ